MSLRSALPASVLLSLFVVQVRSVWRLLPYKFVLPDAFCRANPFCLAPFCHTGNRSSCESYCTFRAPSRHATSSCFPRCPATRSCLASGFERKHPENAPNCFGFQISPQPSFLPGSYASCGEVGPPDPRFRAFSGSCASRGEIWGFFSPSATSQGSVFPGRVEKAIGRTPRNRHNFPKSGVFRNLAGRTPRNRRFFRKVIPVAGSFLPAGNLCWL